MSKLLYMIYSAVVAVWLAGLVVAVAAEALARRRRGCVRRLSLRSVAPLMQALMVGMPERLHLPLVRCVGWRTTLVGLLARLTAATYGVERESVREVVTCYRLDEWLLRRVRRSRGMRRACYLRRLADLPHAEWVTRAVCGYRKDGCRAVRFGTLLVALSAEPSQALRLLAEYEEPLTEVEAAEVLQLLQRGLLPIAWRPLLDASHVNLRRVGLAIVARFGVEEAEPSLLAMVQGGEPSLARQALYVLALLRRSLSRREVRAYVRALGPDERRRLMRYLVSEEYTTEQVRRLFGEEVPYYERLTTTYKRSLVCT